MIRKAAFPALVLAAASMAAPALAQSYGPSHAQSRYGYNQPAWPSVSQRRANLERRIDAGERNGQLSRREARRLRQEFDSLLRLEANYRRGGLTSWERADLDRRFDSLSRQIRDERRDRDGRYDRNDRGDRYDRDRHDRHDRHDRDDHDRRRDRHDN